MADDHDQDHHERIARLEGKLDSWTERLTRIEARAEQWMISVERRLAGLTRIQVAALTIAATAAISLVVALIQSAIAQ